MEQVLICIMISMPIILFDINYRGRDFPSKNTTTIDYNSMLICIVMIHI